MRVPARGDDAGAAAVEFALVSVLLFTVFFGIIQYGYFFLQSSGAEHAAWAGARAASVGIDNCATWKQLVKDSGGAADVQSASVVRDPTAGPMVRGDAIKVTVIWTPLDLGLPFIPFPGANQPETALARVERLGAVTTGCT